MITVMIYSVMFDTEYEFRLNSDVPVSELIEEIAEMIAQKEQCGISGDTEDLMLIDKTAGYVFSPADTLRSRRVKTGDTLYLA